MKENSPFTPGSPAPLELFVGRVEKIKEILRYVEQAKKGKQENVFLAGERGIGKSSLVSFLRSLVDTKDVIALHIFLGGVTNLDELVRNIFEQLLKQTSQQKWFSKITGFFGNHIDQVGLFGISLSFNPPKKELNDLVRYFPEALYNVLEKIKDEKKSLFLALDDINGLSKKAEFAHWYKSFVDYVNTHYNNFPVFIMPVGLPEIRDSLSEIQPSLMRIFRVVDIEKLSDKEVKEFFEKAFEKVKINVEDEAMDIMVRYSSGLPILMHEIGDAVFWNDNDGVIDKEDALGGLIDAAENIGRKYLEPKFYRTIRSDRYKSILRKIGEEFSTRFIRKEIESSLNVNEKRVFNNFLRRMRELGIIIPDVEEIQGTYKFVNELYKVYIFLESQQFKKKRD